MTITLRLIAAFAAAAVAIAAGCATTPAPVDYDKLALDMIRTSFRDQGEAKFDRLDQDALQQACSGATPPAAALASQLLAFFPVTEVTALRRQLDARQRLGLELVRERSRRRRRTRARLL